MGIKRMVDTSFWTDGGTDEFSPEDRYFMLYLLTNPFTTQLGIYKISIKQAAFQMGWSIDAFNVLLDRFENKYHMIIYSEETGEVAILNFLRHSVVKGGKPVEDCIKKDMSKVKNKNLIKYVFNRLYGRSDFGDMNDTVKKIIIQYRNDNDIKNDNDNDNDNERTDNVSYDDSYHDSYYSPPASDDPPKPPKKPDNEPTKADIDNFFEDLWSIYPVKKGKGQVSESKKKALYDIGESEMHRAIHRYLTELKKDAWRKPQNGSTFFNSGYVDYLDKNFEPQAVQPAQQNKTAAMLDESYDMMDQWAKATEGMS